MAGKTYCSVMMRPNREADTSSQIRLRQQAEPLLMASGAAQLNAACNAAEGLSAAPVPGHWQKLCLLLATTREAFPSATSCARGATANALVCLQPTHWTHAALATSRDFAMALAEQHDVTTGESRNQYAATACNQCLGICLINNVRERCIAGALQRACNAMAFVCQHWHQPLDLSNSWLQLLNRCSWA